jgi:type VI secretion system secreted protein VgrG
MADRMLEISTKAGTNAFVVQRFSGHEELGRLYEYQLELLSERGDITAEQLLGTNATVALEIGQGLDPRYFNGYVTRFIVQGQVRTPAFKSNEGFLYLITLSPGLWFMTRASDSKIFSEKSIGDVIMEKLSADTLMTSTNKASDTETRNYIVQYRETDFNFISRLAEHAGVYYYFTHTDGAHEMVLLNKSGDHQPTPNLAEIRMVGTDAAHPGTLNALRMVSEVHAGAFSTGDYNYAAPNTQLASVHSGPAAHDNAGYEIFDHPIDASTADFAAKYAKIRGEELACRYAVVRGEATDRSVQVGFKTTVKAHSVDAMNKEFMVISHSFTAINNLAQSAGGSGSSFQCQFEAIPAATQFRAARVVPRPTIAGTQTALVVADFRNDGDADKGGNLGRVKVRFYWDRYAKESCWARVSTPWAGKGYGFQNMPRVGEEVLVQFLEGDPDRPVVIGRVHNAENMPPFKLPAAATYTGMKSLSMDSSGNSVAGKWNELRFDDSDGAEQIYLQAQFNFDKRVLNDDKVWIGNESHKYVKSDAFAKFDADHHVDTTGDHNEKIGGKLSFDVTSDIHVKSGTMFVVDGGQEVHLKASSKIVLESPMMVSLVCGGNFVTVGPSGVDIKGIMVNVNSGGSKGSGSAISPQAPKAHKEAMKSEGGSATKAPAPPPAPTAFSPKASSFIVAANTAAPFVSSSCPG